MNRAKTLAPCGQCGSVLWRADTVVTIEESKRKLRVCAECARDVLDRRACADSAAVVELESAWRLPAWRVGAPTGEDDERQPGDAA